MKTKNLIFALVFGIGMVASTNAFPIDPISFSTDKAVSKTEVIVEKEIKLQDWMVDADVLATRNGVARENKLELENWMIDGAWTKKESSNTPEAELKVEDWMLASFNQAEDK